MGSNDYLYICALIKFLPQTWAIDICPYQSFHVVICSGKRKISTRAREAAIYAGNATRTRKRQRETLQHTIKELSRSKIKTCISQREKPSRPYLVRGVARFGFAFYRLLPASVKEQRRTAERVRM